MRKNDSITGSFDWPLFITYTLLMVMGLFTVYSVAYNPEHPGLFSFSEKYGRQIMWLGISLFLGILVFLIDSDIYRKFAIPIYGFTIGLLVVVLFMPPINGARAWLGIGSMGIQPGEFAKIGTAILLASFLSGLNLKQQTVRTVVVATVIILLPMVLIILQPDAGTFLVFTSFLFVMYREGVTFDPIILKLTNVIPGIKFKETWVGKHFIPILFVTVFLCVITLIAGHEPIVLNVLGDEPISGYFRIPASLIVISTIGYLTMRWIFPKRERKRALIISIIGFSLATLLSAGVHLAFKSLPKHQKERIELVFGLREDPDGDDYNRNRAMAAVGSGGFQGKGYRKASVSSVQTNHVPESETDFIFCQSNISFRSCNCKC